MSRTPVDSIIVLSHGGDDREALAFEKFLGRSALQRLLYQFAQSGMKHCAVVQHAGLGRVAERISSQAVEVDLGRMQLSHRALTECTDLSFADEVFIISANVVLDSRFIEKLNEYGSAAKLVSEHETVMNFAKVDATQVSDVLKYNGELSECFAQLSGLSHISESTIQTYVPNMRRSFRPYWQELARIEDLERAGDKIMDAAQKGVLDFPARYLHPVPENAMARMASRTSITPNQITIISAILAFIGTYLFATQSYLSALVLAVIAGILDGVDGKLARIKLLSSPYGDRLDHTLDVSFEFSWYVALGWGLSQDTGEPALFIYGFVIIGIMMLARALSGTYLYLTGRQIHDHTAFDRGVRLFAGRRNIYVLLMLVGYIVGDLLTSFYVVIAWALATVAIYAMRNIVALVRKLSPA